jgi:hypothetical protein
MRLAAIVILLCFSAGSGCAQDAAEWREVCDRAKSTPLPRPPIASGVLATCDETALYYGIGGKPNYGAALQCGWRQYSQPQNAVGNMFYGPGVLSMLYANGFGVPRNVDAAIRFACENDWAAPAEFSSRITHLEELRKHPSQFDLCDDITSGLSDGACTAIRTRKRDAERQQRIRKIEQSLSPKSRIAFANLRAAEEKFEEARTRNEVDSSGTSRAAFVLTEEDALKADFMETLQRFSGNGIPRVAPLIVARLREDVDYVFERAQKMDPAMLEKLGTVKVEGIRETQNQWNVLVEEWVRFTKTAHPHVPEVSLRAHLLRARLKQLLALDPDFAEASR